jgi:choline dehydrogenase-like flavoprotein
MPLDKLQATGQGFPPGEPDVQRTTLSLDVLGRFICNTFEEATTNPDFDVVVIGAGMYGCYCAAKVYTESSQQGRRPLRVLVLEAGPFLLHEHSQNIPDLRLPNPFRPVLDTFAPAAQKTRDLVWGMGWRSNTGFPGTAYCVGGKSLYWGGWCPRLRKADLDQWPAEVRDYLTSPPVRSRNLPNRLAPPERESIYEAVEYEIGVKPPDDFVFDPVLGPNEPPGQVGLNEALRARLAAALMALRAGPGTPLQDPEPPPIAVQTQSFVSGLFSPDKFSSLALLMAARREASGDPDNAARLFIVPNSHVSRLIVAPIPRDGADRDGYMVSGLDVFTSSGRRFLAVKPTCTVILALGCIESTRLALESFPTGGHRPNGDEIMGRNLMAHLRFDFPFTVDRQRFAHWVQQNLGKQLRARLQTAGFHLQADTIDGRFHLQVYGTGETTGSEEGLLYRMIPDADLAQRLADTQVPGKIRLIFRACGEMKGDQTAGVRAPGTSWIDLASAADRDQQFDHARAFVNYEDPTNATIWSRMREACIALSREIGAEQTPLDDRHEVGSTWHDSGTLFMGDDPDASVTDASGHFHHIANAVCVDQSLFPTVGSANPVLTGLCLSRKAAETIVARYDSEPPPRPEQIVAEKAEGFAYLLEDGNASKWKPNDVRLTFDRPALIENGTIIEVHGDAGLGVLFYDDPNEFGDFELRLQWKAFTDSTGDSTANSGIFLRAPRPGKELNNATFYDRAIEIQIDDTGYDVGSRRFGSAWHRTGAVYGRAPARVWAQKAPSADNSAGFWNEYRITARAKNVSVELNGRLASVAELPAPLAVPGFIALQYHTGKVQFRSIRIRRL